MEKFFHSVYLDDSLCQGCTNCIKRCPTHAIRVRDGKARIISEFCIDCGECVRTCSHHAKKLRRDTIDALKNYDYTVALPPPSLYLQFNNLDDVNIVLTALLELGFDDVYEVAASAEKVSAATRVYADKHRDLWPVISTACPSVARLIRVRFPSLVEHLLPLKAPVEVAAEEARRRAIEKTGLPADRIGVFFISPCPAKVTYARDPLGVEKSQLDGVLAIQDVYPLLLGAMKRVRDLPRALAGAGRVGVSWGISGGESLGMGSQRYLAADGIENVIRVLEGLEDDRFTGLEFIELDACSGGCVGGVLNVEDPFAARAKLRQLRLRLPAVPTSPPREAPADLSWDAPVRYEPVFRLGSSLSESITMARQVEELTQQFPGLDCGCCGAPSCQALAEDIVRGLASKNLCIYVLRDHIHALSDTCAQLAADAAAQEGDPSQARLRELAGRLEQLDQEITRMDVGHRPAVPPAGEPGSQKGERET